MSSTHRGTVYHAGGVYYTPPTVAAALVDTLYLRPESIVLEPHVGGGAFVEALYDRSGAEALDLRIDAMDIDPEAAGLKLVNGAIVGDFLTVDPPRRPDVVCGNCPYGPGRGTAERHVRRALEVVKPGGTVAFLLRMGFLESQERIPFWQEYPVRVVYVLSERPGFEGTTTDSASYGWFIWERGYTGASELRWLSWKQRDPASARAAVVAAGRGRG